MHPDLRKNRKLFIVCPATFSRGINMARKVGTIPKAPAGRILMKMGAKRVSAEAVEEFVEILTDIAEEIGEQAVRIAKHSGRKTVQEGDIKLAVR